MLKLKLPKLEYDFLKTIGPDIFDFSNGLEIVEADVLILFKDEAQWDAFDADYSGAIVYYGMTPSPEYEITPIGRRMEYIHDNYFTVNVSDY